MLAEKVEDIVSDAADAAPPGVRNPMNATQRVRAVLFDLDGTLYRQKPMRALMALELATLAFRRPLQAPVSWRVLAEFRKAQEQLRGETCDRKSVV